jgi:tRNA pseudouridine55 synthase
MPQSLDGVLVVDKPPAMTSFDVVAIVRRTLKIRAIGHTGTLDPMATGVLALCLGPATRIAQFMLDGVKSYEAVLKLGVTTDTLDADGAVLQRREVPPLDSARIESVCGQFRGRYSQTPPMFSAKKINGKRLYELARTGETVERQPCAVEVFSLTVNDFTADSIRLSVTASKGFFVRVLAESIGEALGCGAHLTALRRTQSGRCTLSQAVSLSALESLFEREALPLLPYNEALSHIAAVTVDAAQAQRVRQGGVVEVSSGFGLVRVLSERGELLALADVERGRLKYRRVLV